MELAKHFIRTNVEPEWMVLCLLPVLPSGIGFSPMFVLLKPTFSLLLRPYLLAQALPSKAERSPTNAFLHPTASADRLAPLISKEIKIGESEIIIRKKMKISFLWNIHINMHSKWIDIFDFHWRLGIDGLSIGPILLIGFITTLATLATWSVTRNS